MKYALVVLALLAAESAFAQQTTAHVVSVGSHSGGSFTSTASGPTHGSVITPTVYEIDVQIGNLIYTVGGVDKKIKVGQDYPATIKNDKHGDVKEIVLEVDGKEHKFGRIHGVREASK